MLLRNYESRENRDIFTELGLNFEDIWGLMARRFGGGGEWVTGWKLLRVDIQVGGILARLTHAGLFLSASQDYQVLRVMDEEFD